MTASVDEDDGGTFGQQPGKEKTVLQEKLLKTTGQGSPVVFTLWICGDRYCW
jgi:hypothetical protein